MGIGDNLMASGMARGAAARGVRVAFGNGTKIKWDQNSEIIFRDNPNIAPPHLRNHSRLEWIEFYKGHRIYNKMGPDDRWIWNYDFRPIPGEMFLTRQEARFGERIGRGFIVMEPNVPNFKTVAPNKQWPVERYDEVAKQLKAAGHRIVQFHHQKDGHRIPGVDIISTPNFRLGVSVLKRAALYIGPEGGLHHAAAALNVSAVVLFGGFVPPQVTGYDTHINLTGGAEACGYFKPCEHCRRAMEVISVDEVTNAANQQLARNAAA